MAERRIDRITVGGEHDYVDAVPMTSVETWSHKPSSAPFGFARFLAEKDDAVTIRLEAW